MLTWRRVDIRPCALTARTHTRQSGSWGNRRTRASDLDWGASVGMWWDGRLGEGGYPARRVPQHT